MTEDNIIPTAYEKITAALMPSSYRTIREAQKTRPSFVHYTSAEVAIKIIRNREIWMRRASLMNDFSEVEYGLRGLAECYRSEDLGTRFRTALETASPGVIKAFEEHWKHWEDEFVLRSYITSLSCHNTNEDKLGRLSMWRAYGGNRGVAIVVNPEAVISESSDIRAFTVPVNYIAEGQYSELFREMCEAIEQIQPLISQQKQEDIVQALAWAFAHNALSTKHIGFHEEQEWRIVATPGYFGSDELVPSIEIISGLPQPIYKIPIAEIADVGGDKLGLNGILKRIIIGPADHAYTVKDAIVHELKLAGVKDSEDKVVVSDIPLRSS